MSLISKQLGEFLKQVGNGRINKWQLQAFMEDPNAALHDADTEKLIGEISCNENFLLSWIVQDGGLCYSNRQLGGTSKIVFHDAVWEDIENEPILRMEKGQIVSEVKLGSSWRAFCEGATFGDYDEGVKYTFIGKGGKLCYAAKTGTDWMMKMEPNNRQVWRHVLPEIISQPTMAEGQFLYCASGKIDKGEGVFVVWGDQLHGPYQDAKYLQVVDGHLLFAAKKGELWSVYLDGTEIKGNNLHFREIKDLQMHENRLYFAAEITGWWHVYYGPPGDIRQGRQFSAISCLQVHNRHYNCAAKLKGWDIPIGERVKWDHEEITDLAIRWDGPSIQGYAFVENGRVLGKKSMWLWTRGRKEPIPFGSSDEVTKMNYVDDLLLFSVKEDGVWFQIVIDKELDCKKVGPYDEIREAELVDGKIRFYARRGRKIYEVTIPR